jgi:hypothetical protein
LSAVPQEAHANTCPLSESTPHTAESWNEPVPAVLTVHDVQPFDLPENFSPVKRAYIHKMVPRAVREALRRDLPIVYWFGVVPGQYRPFFPAYVAADHPERQEFRKFCPRCNRHQPHKETK